MKRMAFKLLVLASSVLLVTACGGDSEDDNNNGNGNGGTTDSCTTELTVGVMYEETGGVLNEVEAIRMAATDINDSGALGEGNCIVVQEELFGGEDTATQRFNSATSLINSGAIGLISQYSSSARAAIRATNKTIGPSGEANSEQAGTGEFIHCSGSSTSTSVNLNENRPAANDAGKPMADDNDSLYRAVADDLLQSKVVWEVLKDSTGDADTVGILYDPNDSYSNDFRVALENLADGGTRNIALLPGGVSGEMGASDVTAVTDLYDAISPAPQALVAIGLPLAAGKVITALTAKFSGVLVVTDGMLSDDFFDGVDSTFSDWLEDEDNKVVATTPYYGGAAATNSSTWTDRLKATTGDPLNDASAFTPMHADCMYQIALALLQGNAGGHGMTQKAVYEGMKTFKFDPSESSSRTAISPNSDGFVAAKAAIDAGDAVYLNGAAGPQIFDERGDRHYILQAYGTLSIIETTLGYDWSLDKLWENLEP